MLYCLLWEHLETQEELPPDRQKEQADSVSLLCFSRRVLQSPTATCSAGDSLQKVPSLRVEIVCKVSPTDNGTNGLSLPCPLFCNLGRAQWGQFACTPHVVAWVTFNSSREIFKSYQIIKRIFAYLGHLAHPSI
jgi:hypothetical protein